MPNSPPPTTSPSLAASPLKLPEPVSYVTATSTTSTQQEQQAQFPCRRITFAAATALDGRRPSVQYETRKTEATLRPGSAKPKSQRRMPSPPAPGTFQDRVSFDTFDNRDASDFSLTLNSKHKDYKYTKRSRTFLCGTDQNDYSEFALEWLIDELVDDGDEIVCLRVVDKDSKINSDASIEEGRYRIEAKKLLGQVIAKNHDDDKAISLVLEFAVGKVQETIQRMIEIYEPVMLIVGTRGRSLGGIQGLLPGSVSKYCLQHSPVPVIVVRPTSKREKKKKKRQADPSRRSYMDILELSGARGGHVLDPSNRNSIVAESGSATEKEARAVAAAIGLPTAYDKVDNDGSPLTKVQSGRSDYTSGPDSPNGEFSPGDARGPVVMKSPDLGNLESPEGSESSDDDDEEAAKERGRNFPVSLGGGFATNHDALNNTAQGGQGAAG